MKTENFADILDCTIENLEKEHAERMKSINVSKMLRFTWTLWVDEISSESTKSSNGIFM